MVLGANRVIKLSAVMAHAWNNVARVLRYVKRHPNDSVMRIYDFGVVLRSGDRVFYYVESERLEVIADLAESEGVAVLFNAVLWNKKLEWDSDELPPKNKHVSRVRRSFKRYPLVHDDIHDSNVMRTSRGFYKLIDCESFRFRSEITPRV